MDGALTARGIQLYGLTIERNILLRSLMECAAPYIHYVVVIILVKSIAIGIIIHLVHLGETYPIIVRLGLFFMCVFYLMAAVLPWLKMLGYIYVR
jgi:hypothetical protein